MFTGQSVPDAAQVRTNLRSVGAWPQLEIRSGTRAAVIAAVGLVRRAVDLRLEPVKNGADDRRADRLQPFLGPPYLVEIAISGADDQNDRINDAREEQRIIGCQNRG